MTYNVMLTGVGGEGVLMTSVIVARAANFDGYEVRGTQFHGLAQRGGSIPTQIRFGKKVYSPMIPRAKADLILGLEPIEAARSCFFASKEKTNFVVDTYPVKPVYLNLLGHTYPSYDKIKKMIAPFAKKCVFVDASNICEKKFGNPIFGNVMSIGVAFSMGALPLSKSSVLKSIKTSVPRGAIKENLEAFDMGLKFKA